MRYCRLRALLDCTRKASETRPLLRDGGAAARVRPSAPPSAYVNRSNDAVASQPLMRVLELVHICKAATLNTSVSSRQPCVEIVTASSDRSALSSSRVAGISFHDAFVPQGSVLLVRPGYGERRETCAGDSSALSERPHGDSWSPYSFGLLVARRRLPPGRRRDQVLTGVSGCSTRSTRPLPAR